MNLTPMTLGALITSAAAAGTGLEITAWTSDSGGGRSAGGTLEVTGTIGQPDATASNGGGMLVDGGFWERLPNDACHNAWPIMNVVTPFTTLSANTDGPSHPECQFDGQTYHDVWFEYTAECTGTLTVSTCEELGGAADYDTDLAVYESCGGPGGCDFALLGCNDDDGANPCGGAPFYHSTVTIDVTAGACYLIRVGGWSDADSGNGELFVSCAGCAPDLDGSGDVGFGDLLSVLSSWGACGDPCPADLDDSGDIGFGDLLVVLSSWGPC